MNGGGGGAAPSRLLDEGVADTNRPQNRTLNVITVCPVEVKCKLNSIKKDLSWLKKGGLATQSNSPGSAPVMCSITWHSTREQ